MNDILEAAVVGGGISGLYATHRLNERFGEGAVGLFEATDYVGGRIRSDRVNGYVCDWGPNGFLDNQPLVLDWIEKLGLSGDLVRANEASARRYLLLEGKLVELLPPPKFLLSPVLSLAGRLRLLREPFVPPYSRRAPESVWDFAARRIGREAADTLVSAMVLGIFGGDAKRLSLPHVFPRMAEMEQEYGSLIKAMRAKKKDGSGSPMGPRGTLTTLSGGIGRLVQRAGETVANSAMLNAEVERISVDGDTHTLHLKSGATVATRRLFLATPAYVTAAMVRHLDEKLARALDRIEYAGIAVVCTGHDASQVGRDPDGFGFLIPPKEGRRVLGCIWTSSVFDGFAPEGKVFLRTMLGGAIYPEVVTWTNEELMSAVRSDVFEPMSISKEPEFTQIFRHHRGIPQYGLNHGEILDVVDKFEAKHPKVALIGNAYRGVSMNDSVAAAHRAVERVAPMA